MFMLVGEATGLYALLRAPGIKWHAARGHRLAVGAPSLEWPALIGLGPAFFHVYCRSGHALLLLQALATGPQEAYIKVGEGKAIKPERRSSP
jgi:hypothetical protein